MGKVSADIKKEFDSKPVYNNEFVKTKLKPHGDKVTNFCDKKIPKVDSNHTCLAVISSYPCLGKQRIFLGVASILKMCLCPYT